MDMRLPKLIKAMDMLSPRSHKERMDMRLPKLIKAMDMLFPRSHKERMDMRLPKSEKAGIFENITNKERVDKLLRRSTVRK